jgi:hypothetical protein
MAASFEFLEEFQCVLEILKDKGGNVKFLQSRSMSKWVLRARKLFFIIAGEEIIPDLSLRGTKHPQPVISMMK